MSVSNIPDRTKLILWGKAAGRCQYAGCNKALWRDDLTKAEFNQSYIAHIIADKPGGPRGDVKLSLLLAQDLSNLMLMCDTHHRLIDIEDEDGHPVDRLKRMKAEHEARIETLTEIAPEKETTVVRYTAPIDTFQPFVHWHEVCEAICPERYASESAVVNLGHTGSQLEEGKPIFWPAELESMQAHFQSRLESRLSSGEIIHVSLFGWAPQPLLIALGTMFDQVPVDIFQRGHRESRPWRWDEGFIDPSYTGYKLLKSESIAGQPVLVLALSFEVSDDRIRAVLGDDIAIWKVTIDTPSRTYLTHRSQLEDLRAFIHPLLAEIEQVHGKDTPLHIFPVAPVSCSVELGRARLSKGSMPWKIYDQNNKKSGFVHALDLV